MKMKNNDQLGRCSCTLLYIYVIRIFSWLQSHANVSARQAGFNDTPYGYQLNTGHFAVQVQLLWNFYRFISIQNKIFRSVCVTLVKFFKGYILKFSRDFKFCPSWTAVMDWIRPKWEELNSRWNRLKNYRIICPTALHDFNP